MKEANVYGVSIFFFIYLFLVWNYNLLGLVLSDFICIFFLLFLLFFFLWV